MIGNTIRTGPVTTAGPLGPSMRSPSMAYERAPSSNAIT